MRGEACAVRGGYLSHILPVYYKIVLDVTFLGPFKTLIKSLTSWRHPSKECGDGVLGFFGCGLIFGCGTSFGWRLASFDVLRP